MSAPMKERKNHPQFHILNMNVKLTVTPEKQRKEKVLSRICHGALNLASKSNTFPFIPLFFWCRIPLSRKTKRKACLLLHREPRGWEVRLLPSCWLWVLYNSVHRGAASHSSVINKWATVQAKPERPSLSCHHTCFHAHTGGVRRHEGWLGAHRTPGNASRLSFDNSKSFWQWSAAQDREKTAEFHSFVVTRDARKGQFTLQMLHNRVFMQGIIQSLIFSEMVS